MCRHDARVTCDGRGTCSSSAARFDSSDIAADMSRRSLDALEMLVSCARRGGLRPPAGGPSQRRPAPAPLRAPAAAPAPALPHRAGTAQPPRHREMSTPSRARARTHKHTHTHTPQGRRTEPPCALLIQSVARALVRMRSPLPRLHPSTPAPTPWPAAAAARRSHGPRRPLPRQRRQQHLSSTTPATRAQGHVMKCNARACVSQCRHAPD
jgi:hypothetical protein